MAQTATTATRRAIWIGSLADYNAGNLLGEWVDVDGKDADELQTEADRILKKAANLTRRSSRFSITRASAAGSRNIPRLQTLPSSPPRSTQQSRRFANTPLLLGYATTARTICRRKSATTPSDFMTSTTDTIQARQTSRKSSQR